MKLKNHFRKGVRNIIKLDNQMVCYELCLLGMLKTLFIKFHQYWMLSYVLNKDNRHTNIDRVKSTRLQSYINNYQQLMNGQSYPRKKKPTGDQDATLEKPP